MIGNLSPNSFLLLPTNGVLKLKLLNKAEKYSPYNLFKQKTNISNIDTNRILFYEVSQCGQS